MSSPSVYLARQPIFDRQMKLSAYELLFRDGEENQANVSDNENATAEVMVSALTDIGLENIVGPYPAYINMTYGFLTGDLLVPQLNNKVVLEVLEDVVPDDKLIEGLTGLVESGYSIALDDFVYRPEFDPLLKLAEVVKFDVFALNNDELKQQIDLVRPFNVALLAEKVETFEEFEFCKSLGFNFFQGYFFCRPEILEGKRPSGNKLMMLNIMTKLQDPEIDIEDLEILIAQDASLAYHLLRHINSAFFSLSTSITSMKHAIAMAGLDTIKRWTTLTLMLKLADHKTPELVMTGMVRAKMCQILGKSDPKNSDDRYFMVGLFSVLDALLDTPKAEIMGTLPLENETIDALLEYSGTLGRVLKLVEYYEQSTDPKIGLGAGKLSSAYCEAIKWGESMRSALG